MAVVEGQLKRAVQEGLPDLCLRASAGSAWSALLVAIHSKPADLAELMRIVGCPRTGKFKVPAFDACSDAWAIYMDALANGADLGAF